MKKKLVLLLCLTMVMLAIAGCGATETDVPDVVDPADTATAVKTGMSVLTAAAKSKNAEADADGLAEAGSVIVAVTVDTDGKIVNCTIDTAQTKINFSKAGEIVTPLDTVFLGKQERGADYGMGKASTIGKEWNEQADAFAKYVLGKTVEEVKGIAVNAEGVPSDADLVASVTMHITDYVNAIEKAVANAQEMGASADDMIGIGVVTTIDKSKNAAEEDGLAQAYSNYAAVTFDADGVITSCIIDASQTNVKFDKVGVITSDIAGPFQTKNELGEAYGMIKASTIGKEWNEQAAAFAEYVVGKTVEEVNGIAVTAEDAPADADLSASVTVHIGPFKTIIEKAFNAAK